MANQRRTGQSLVGFWAEETFAQKIDSIRGHKARSQFLRDAVAEYLRRRGVAVPADEIAAPDRKGKGGPRKKG